jgi:N-acetylmuramoyl-L-alanine amidase CwlA
MEIQRNITAINRRVANRQPGDIKYLVVHYVGSVSTAYNNTAYFKSINHQASAHYFVDETSVWQCVEDKDIAWHCGAEIGQSYKHAECRNENSIGVELCCKQTSASRWYFEPETKRNAIWLLTYLVNRYGLTEGQILRHYDVTGKNCPAPFVDNWYDWRDFKAAIFAAEREDEMKEVTDNMKVALDALAGAGIVTKASWENKLGETASLGEIMQLLAAVKQVGPWKK